MQFIHRKNGFGVEKKIMIVYNTTLFGAGFFADIPPKYRFTNFDSGNMTVRCLLQISERTVTMRLILQQNKRFYPWIAAVVIACAVAAGLLGANIFLVIAASLVLAAALLVKIEFPKKINKLFILPFFLVSALFVFLLMQFTIGAGIGKRLNIIKFILNVLVIAALHFFVFSICGNMRASVLSVLIFSETLAVIDHLVVQTRSMEIVLTDIFSIMTGLSVAAGYSFTLSEMTVTALFFAVGFGVIAARTVYPDFADIKSRLFSIFGSVAIITLASVLVSNSWGNNFINFIDKYWMYRASENNGFYLNILHTASATNVKTPLGYSIDELKKLLEEQTEKGNTTEEKKDTTSEIPEVTTEKKPETETPVTDNTTTGEPETDAEKKKPNIIVVMDETFSDLQAVADYLYENGYASEKLQTDEEILPYFNSLDSSASNIEKGWALSSVFGGNTANSEFEFLTGHSMAFLPQNTVAYNLYLEKNNAFSMVDILKKEGYHTVGMHPEVATNWSRNRIYSYYGFDETLFIDDFTDLDEDDYYRGHVSDSAVFDKIISLYENNENSEDDSSLFVFAVTMMNHGGYSTENFDASIHITNYTNYKGAQEYFSSINKSDEALKKLIEYFSSVDEETVIVFFGDHQPSLSSGFYSKFFGIADDSDQKLNQAKYVVPYLIWANFDFEDSTTEITSLNYLGVKTLDIAGIEKTEYMNFLTKVRADYPAITAAGYWDTDGEFYSFIDSTVEETTLLKLYKYLQYNALFDADENKLKAWFIRDYVGDVPHTSAVTSDIVSTEKIPVTEPPTSDKKTDDEKTVPNPE